MRWVVGAKALVNSLCTLVRKGWHSTRTCEVWFDALLCLTQSV